MIYDKSQSFKSNIQNGPIFSADLLPIVISDSKLCKNFLDYSIHSPLGISACAIMTGKGIALMSKLGFSVFTYKTVRYNPTDAHPLPNICYVDGSQEITKQTINSYIREQELLHEDEVAFANSFGNNCLDWDWLRQDIAYARSNVQKGQVLIVSVYGVESTECSEAQDFVRVALLAQEVGAQAIELNLSCPNVKGLLAYKNAEQVYTICQAVVKAVSTPVIIKIGVFDTQEQMKTTFIAAARAGVRGVCGINTVPMHVVDQQGNSVFGSRTIAGISGNPIRTLGKKFAQDARVLIDTEKLNLTLLATGGVLAPIHIDEYLSLGADVVMSSTGAMWQPLFASEWIKMKEL